ncbi:MAG TPA: cupin domain-containing protein [Terracidiphilus sp.]|nr:cupin domain-containing protein [Terracidiphilus sp.]
MSELAILHPYARPISPIGMEVIHQADLPFVGSSYEFVGAKAGGLGISMFVVVAEIGRGPRLHRHRYDELVYVIEGRSHWTVEERELDAGPGDILVVRAGEKHKFVALTPLRQIDVHLNPTFEQEDLE